VAYKQISPIGVILGGTNKQSFTVYTPVCGGTTTTGALQSVASLGSAGQVLTSNGAGSLATFQNAPASSAGGWILISSQDVAAPASSVDFTSGISSTYDNYALVITNYLSDTTLSSIDLCLQVSSDGGATYINSGYNCTDNTTESAVSGPAPAWGNNSVDTYYVLASALYNDGSTSVPLGGTYFLFNLTTNSGPLAFSGSYSGTTSSSFNVLGITSAMCQFGANVNAITVFAASGDIGQGRFSLYGLQQ